MKVRKGNNSIQLKSQPLCVLVSAANIASRIDRRMDRQTDRQTDRQSTFLKYVKNFFKYKPYNSNFKQPGK